MGYKNYVGSMGAGFQAWLVADRVVAPPDYAMVCPSPGRVPYSAPVTETRPWYAPRVPTPAPRDTA